MTAGQIAKLQELSRCWMTWKDKHFLDWIQNGADFSGCVTGDADKHLRRLWHQYQPQIVAMRKNRKQD